MIATDEDSRTSVTLVLVVRGLFSGQWLKCHLEIFLCRSILYTSVRARFYRYTGAFVREGVLLSSSGWKLLHADVFRTPHHRMPLAGMVGCGAHLLMLVRRAPWTGLVSYAEVYVHRQQEGGLTGLLVSGGTQTWKRRSSFSDTTTCSFSV